MSTPDDDRASSPGTIGRLVNGVSLGRWPLLVSGLLLLLLGVYLADPPDREGVRSLVLGVGSVLVGAGVVLVAWGHHDPTRRDPRLRTRATDPARRAELPADRDTP